MSWHSWVRSLDPSVSVNFGCIMAACRCVTAAVFRRGVADQDPRRAVCVDAHARHDSTGVSANIVASMATAKRQPGGEALPFPACVYTRQQLQRLTALAEPWLTQLGYGVPLACQEVWRGQALGGTDAMPIHE